ncbi:hypothetical protein U6G28_01125 [Actinomycetaceae bacterium MB13-C1-2]|nr:hypothetical protein U6G28_01125 [Actinomycetaceae bacterium MB13-C1-2]
MNSLSRALKHAIFLGLSGAVVVFSRDHTSELNLSRLALLAGGFGYLKTEIADDR